MKLGYREMNGCSNGLMIVDFATDDSHLEKTGLDVAKTNRLNFTSVLINDPLISDTFKPNFHVDAAEYIANFEALLLLLVPFNVTNHHASATNENINLRLAQQAAFLV